MPPPFAWMMLIAASLSVAGCAPQLWAKPGGTPAEFENTKAACNAQAYAMYPPFLLPVMVSPGYVTPVQTSCSGEGRATRCVTTGGVYFPPSYVPVDQNQGARQGAVRSCLIASGWQPVKDKEEAALVTNAVPGGIPIAPTGAGTAIKEAARVACQQEAEQSSVPFARAFDACMRARGF